MNFKSWLQKEGPLDDPHHAMFGDFDHIPWLQDDIRYYAKKRAEDAEKKLGQSKPSPYATTIIWKGSTADMGKALDGSKTKTFHDDPTKEIGPQDCAERIKELESRISSIEDSLRTHFVVKDAKKGKEAA